MQTLGIDLSTDPKKVWTCEIDWSRSPPAVTSLVRLADQPDPLRAPAFPPPPPAEVPSAAGGAAFVAPPPHAPLTVPTIRDEPGLVAALVERIVAFGPSAEGVIGVDAPLGWPSAFVDAISDWDDGDPQGFRKRPELRLRATDRFVHAVSRITPMSVSTDRTGSTAMLLAEVLSRSARRLDRQGFDRITGADGIAEVNPGVALRAWLVDGHPIRVGAYKGAQAPRESILHVIVACGFELTLSQARAMARSDDALDAFLCALVARAVAVGACLTVTDPVDVQQLLPKTSTSGGPETLEQLTDRLDLARATQGEAAGTAATEGWVHVPTRTEFASALALTPGSATPLPLPEPIEQRYAAGPWSAWPAPVEPWPDDDGEPFDDDGIRHVSPLDDDWRARL